MRNQYFIEGNRYFLIGEKTYKIQPGTLVMIHPDCVHNTFSGKYIYHDRVLVLYEASKFPRIAQSMGIDLETFFKNIMVSFRFRQRIALTYKRS